MKREKQDVFGKCLTILIYMLPCQSQYFGPSQCYVLLMYWNHDFITNKITYENDICARSNPENSKCNVSLKQKMQRIGCQIFPLSFINRGPAICDPPFTTHSHHHVYPATITTTTDSHHATATTIHKVTELSQPEVMLRSLAFLGYGKMGMN